MYYGRLQEDMMSRSSIEQDAGNSGALPAVSWKKSAIICKPTIATSEGVCVYNICFTPIYRPLSPCTEACHCHLGPAQTALLCSGSSSVQQGNFPETWTRR